MKPVKNKVFCVDCRRTKMLFETKEKANNFMRYNSEEIEFQSGRRPVRSYYCQACGGWHVTSRMVTNQFPTIVEMYLIQNSNLFSSDVNKLIKRIKSFNLNDYFENKRKSYAY